MPFADGEIRVDLACGPDATGRWHGWVAVRLNASVLRDLGLHPDQPAVRHLGPEPPSWWTKPDRVTRRHGGRRRRRK
ncbi:hypothetical protein [Actinomadura harenae]|uniref:Uncharacterized protein n=1 Tax=Actinomadura harenae TaxID=2483351 RepID=A0A3M2MA61_9ACTN|nr:hypothetical protein [Actinomadura harenae]RMI45763.1 hypothetical protein EBO15_09260 [Actinomadura harenae]